MSEYAVAHLDEIDELTDGREPWRPVRHHFGITAFGVTAWTGREVGDRIINEHDEAEEQDQQEELYLVQQGRARRSSSTASVSTRPAGTFVFARPSVRRTAFAEEPNTTIVVVGGRPGNAYEPERLGGVGAVPPALRGGRVREVADRAAAVLASDPPYGVIYYNVACCESLAGRTEDALDHLRRAIELSDRFRAFAKGDSDLDALRAQPGFAELVGE